MFDLNDDPGPDLYPGVCYVVMYFPVNTDFAPRLEDVLGRMKLAGVNDEQVDDLINRLDDLLEEFGL